MGHITFLKINGEKYDVKGIEKILVSAPYFTSRTKLNCYEYRGPINLKKNNIEPDIAISIEKDGIEMNALGDYEICNAVSKHIEAELRKQYKEINELL